MPTHVLKVDPDHSQLRLDVYLAQNLSDVPSRTFVKRLIEAGQVSINKKTAKANQKVVSGDAVVVELSALPQDENIAPENIPLDIVYEDENLLLVNKPSGLLVHPVNAQNTSGTLVNALLHHCKTLSSVNAETRPGIVHRLDRETSGLLLVAKDNKTHTKLAKQFERHEIKKQYLALVEGKVEFDEGVVDAALGKHPRYYDRKKISFDDAAKEATTFYKVKRRFKNKTLVALFPQTGRTHQLRVHMAHLGHPILGDDKYGKKDSFPRLALHAQGIGFVHPHSNQYMEFWVKPPQEFLQLD